MECPRCHAGVEVQHSYPAGSAGRTADVKCRACGQRFTSVTILLPKPDGRKEGYGNGAHALSERMKNGAKVVFRVEPITRSA